ncbi:GNAT family N-acetyltransferase [Neptuniibacter sp. QD37_6]|uniref:GNAT family N-acetyltransferase n=1 Tax=Neptuniibacter sp. QD37_6 TaxID=3398210 RepID=UPI0039F4C564
MTDTKVITGPRLILTEFEDGDITPEYVSWLNDPAVVKFSNQRFREHSLESSRAYVKSFTGTENELFKIVHAETGGLLGSVNAYVDTRHLVADIGIMIGNKAFWGQGFGQEAWTLMMEFLFVDRGVRKVTGGTLATNKGMVEVMKRSGMHLEGVREKHFLIGDQAVDIHLFARFRT